jgi:23S rRNA pseudouridine955/2504/2580 synthase
MSQAGHEVSAEEAGLRLDRWFRRHFPALSHGRLERMLRTGQVRVGGRRVKSGHRLAPGDLIRVPPAAAAETPERAPRPPPFSDTDRRALEAMVLYKDASVLAINKPPGLAVQGGSAVSRHLDAMLDGLRFEARERPRLVHRLDKDTSGIMLLARTAKAATALTRAFREDRVAKIYWAIVVGVPSESLGRIELPLAKRGRPGGERVQVDEAAGRRAVTELAVVDRVGREAAWVAFRPRTGRTHQLRAHAAHLHAHSLRLGKPGGGELALTAPLPPHFAETMRSLGFAAADYVDPFPD